MLNVPNTLTIVRILLVPAYMIALYSTRDYSNQIACLFFVIAAITDYLDGAIARKYDLITNFGKVIDPVADKIMVAAAMIVLVDLDRLAAWIVVVMLFRDFAVGGLRDLASSQGMIIAAGFWGKLKTVFQMIAISFLIFHDNIIVWPLSKLGITGAAISSTIQVTNTISIPTHAIGLVLIYVALIASVFSGVLYYFKYYKKLS